MLRSYEVLRDNDPVREHYQRRFKHILIDEFQDTNRLQYAWIKMFSTPPLEGLHALGQRGVRRGRRRPEHLRLSRRARGQHGRLRARVPGAAPDQAGTELPQRQQHPRFGQPADQPQQPAPGQEPAHRRRRRRAGARVRGHQRLRRGAVDGRRDEAARARGHAQARDGRALPQQRAKPRGRNRAVQRRHAVPRVRRPALLRARRDQARAGLPAPAGERERRHQLSCAW